MAGSRKDVRARLLRAALELVSERGYDRTTAADIAERADVTERTFFRHFADKREALFDGERELQRLLAAAIEHAPAGTSPADVLRHAFVSMVPDLTRDAELKRQRQLVIMATPELRERELAKEARLVSTAAQALEARGVDHAVAAIGATAGMAVLSRARLSWLADASEDLTSLLTVGYADLRATFDRAQPAADGR